MRAPTRNLISIGHVAPAIALGLMACGQIGEPGNVEQSRAAVFEGTRDEGDPAVVATTNRFKDPLCTGTLISPKVVLTAGHCVETRPAFVFFGTDAYNEEGTYVAVAGSEPHPDYDGRNLENDLGLVILKDPAPADPVPLMRQRPRVGETIRKVGFGEVRDSGAYGIKREATRPLLEVERTRLWLDGVSCDGDSGGPSFMDPDGQGERIAGVTSGGSCGYPGGIGPDTRVDAYTDWIDARLAALDPDTDGNPDSDPDTGGDSDYSSSGQGCRMGGAKAPGGALWVLLALLGILAIRRRLAATG